MRMAFGGYQSGTLIDGRYRLLRCLAEGGMGCVWLARHEGLDAPVALKVIKPEGCPAGADALTEAHITAQLRHPAIVSIFDSGRTVWGDPFFAMEYLEGRSLDELLRHEGSMPASAAVRLLLPIVDALSLCHERGFAHRDITPANIFLAREQGRTHAKLLDFGVAKPACARAGVPELSGTPGYMAPEQASGEVNADHRVDIWALCAVLYEAVCGRPAIEGKSCADLLAATLDPAVARLQERGHGESSLWLILERGLHRQAARRYQSMRDLHDALVGWLDARAAADRPLAAGQVATLREPASPLASARPRAANDGGAPALGEAGHVRPRRAVQWVATNDTAGEAAAAARAPRAVAHARAPSTHAAALLLLLAAAASLAVHGSAQTRDWPGTHAASAQLCE